MIARSDQTGPLRVAINTANPATVLVEADGGLSGPSIDMAHKLAGRLGRPLEFIRYASAGAVVAAADSDDWDLTFLAIDPARAHTIHFTVPYHELGATYAVAENRPWRTVAEVDTVAVTIGASRGAAYGLHLRRSLKHAALREFDTLDQCLGALTRAEIDAASGIRQALDHFVRQNPGYRTLEDDFLRIQHAVAVRRSDTAFAQLMDQIVAQEVNRDDAHGPAEPSI